MLISIALVAALLGIIVLAFRPERRKPYNEFRRPSATTLTSAVYGDVGAAGISSGVDGGGCGGDGGGGGC